MPEQVKRLKNSPSHQSANLTLLAIYAYAVLSISIPFVKEVEIVASIRGEIRVVIRKESHSLPQQKVLLPETKAKEITRH